MLNVAARLGWKEVRPLGPQELRAPPFNDAKLVEVVEGRTRVGGREIVLYLGVDRRFPVSLPRVYLRPPKGLGFLPHVEHTGLICYQEPEGLLIDTERSGEVLVWAAERAVRALEEQLAFLEWGEVPPDFMDEFPAYLRRLSRGKALHAFLNPDGRVRKIRVYRDDTGGKREYQFVSDSQRVVEAYFTHRPEALRSLTQRTALYLPLREGTRVFPPEPEKPWTLDLVRRIVHENLTPENWREFEKICASWKPKREELVILGLPRPSGGITLVGLLFQNVEGGHPLLTGTASDQPEYLLVKRLDPGYLLPRGGAFLELRQASVLLVGCGAVGGYLALALAQAGIGSLTLVDPDVIAPENTFRHVLGRDAERKNKAVALKAEIERKYPYVEVNAVEAHIEGALHGGSINLSEFGLLIIATGNPTLELALNRKFYREGLRSPVIFTWLDPYGIGGHALLTRPGQPGCLRCLFTSPEEPDGVLRDRASFAAPGQEFSKDDLGCGSLYTPFGALDAQRTAVLAAQLAVEALLGREEGSPLRSWKGSSQEFAKKGFRLSSRYGLDLDELHARRYSYVVPTCPVCGGGQA